MTKHQRAYRKALIEKGLPEVYAHMAAKYVVEGRGKKHSLSILLMAFQWQQTNEGSEFWRAVFLEAYDVSAN